MSAILKKQEKIPNPTRDSILQQLSSRKDIKEITFNIGQGKFFGDELYQELFVMLCTLPENKLIDMYMNNWLDFYIIRTLTNMFKSSSSRFYYEIKRQYINKVDNVTVDEDGKCTDRMEELATPLVDPEPHRLTNSLYEAIEELGWYDKGMMKLYLELGTLKKVSEKSRINTTYVSESIKNGKRQLKEKVAAIEKRKEDSILYDQPDIPDTVLESFKKRQIYE